MRVAVLVLAFFFSSTAAPVLFSINRPGKREILPTRPVRLRPFKPRGFRFKHRKNHIGRRIKENPSVLSALENCLQNAWVQYGPKPIERAGGEFVYAFNSFDPQRNFQPMGSEWDSHVKKVPKREVMTPSGFSRFLSRYIDFELKHQDTAESIRKFIFGSIVGFMVAGWVGIGALIGGIPVKLLLAAGRRARHEDSIKEKLALILDNDWLSRLESKLKKEDEGWMRDAVTCCIFPGKGSEGTAECQMIRSVKQTPVKCLSDFLYKLSFGGQSDLRSEEFQLEQNVINHVTSATMINL